jgi:hypothetical protein
MSDGVAARGGPAAPDHDDRSTVLELGDSCSNSCTSGKWTSAIPIPASHVVWTVRILVDESVTVVVYPVAPVWDALKPFVDEAIAVVVSPVAELDSVLGLYTHHPRLSAVANKATEKTDVRIRAITALADRVALIVDTIAVIVKAIAEFDYRGTTIRTDRSGSNTIAHRHIIRARVCVRAITSQSDRKALIVGAIAVVVYAVTALGKRGTPILAHGTVAGTVAHPSIIIAKIRVRAVARVVDRKALVVGPVTVVIYAVAELG